MTIKEIEELTGMARANIRFYENEGLISPNRNANGYRDYSMQDAEILQKIKLLRSLHISLEEIKALHTGKHRLSDTLEQHIKHLAKQKTELDYAQRICTAMRQDGVSYENLNTEKYWSEYAPAMEPSGELEQDSIPKVRAPWRRFFARTLDEVLYASIWNLVLMLVFRVNISNMGTGGSILDTIITLALTVVLEPLQLSVFGTTLGKSILGLSVRDNEDRKLTYNEAMARTWQVLWHGCGFHIPLFNLYRNWKSYKTCSDGSTLSWEYDSTLILKDEKPWRTAVYIGVRILLFIMLLVSALSGQVPSYRGDITVAEFCENYRYLEEYYDLGGKKILNDEGKWIEKESTGNDIVIYIEESMFAIEEKQDFVFEVSEEGYVQSIDFTLTYSPTEVEDNVWIPTCQEQMQLAALAFIGAQKEFNYISNDSSQLVSEIAEYTAEDFSFSRAGITVSCDVEIIGHASRVSDFMVLAPLESGECSYYLHFSMRSGRIME